MRRTPTAWSSWATRRAQERDERIRATHDNDVAMAEHERHLRLTTGLRHALLALHAPQLDVYPHLPLLCLGCDGTEGSDGEPALWPCRSYDLGRTPPAELPP